MYILTSVPYEDCKPYLRGTSGELASIQAWGLRGLICVRDRALPEGHLFADDG